ncbi:site-specific integrase [Spirillospora sp. NPDC029432]|uniref:site-specific integrase n=1 Tax=Spirillospora sp. NPDC029432 TaxID=3154599 RepID=UPI0034572C72
MAYAEKRGNLWRARWKGPDGHTESQSGFQKKTDAENYGRDQEAAIRNNSYVDPRAGKITVTEWVNLWFPALDLEPNTLDNYRYFIEVHILPAFGDRELRSLEREEIATWEKRLRLSRRTAREARSTFTNLLNDAIPRYLQTNPAARRRGKGRKGQRRIAEAERKQKVWATPLQSLLLAERCALLSGEDTDFVMNITAAYTGARWGELLGLPPDRVRPGAIDIHWKLYELNGRFYRGRPKDGSMRTIDTPPFLDELLAHQMAGRKAGSCTCRGTEEPWCPGGRYVFLSPTGAHFRRSNYSERLFRPAADGWHPKRNGKHGRPAMPVLVDMGEPWPGKPVPPWPPAEAGEPFTPPTGRGVTRLVSDEERGRCSECRRTQLLRIDGTLIGHNSDGGRCPGGGKPPAEDVALASWLPLSPGLTPHRLRHGHQPWMDDTRIPYVLQSERMGHEVPGMRGTYAHPTPDMRIALVKALQQFWDESLAARARLAPRSGVAMLDTLLSAYRGR